MQAAPLPPAELLGMILLTEDFDGSVFGRLSGVHFQAANLASLLLLPIGGRRPDCGAGNCAAISSVTGVFAAASSCSCLRIPSSLLRVLSIAALGDRAVDLPFPSLPSCDFNIGVHQPSYRCFWMVHPICLK